MQLGKPPGVNVVNPPVKVETEPGSPTGTVRLTSPPRRLGLGPFGASNARLSLEVHFTASPRPTAAVLSVATSVCVLHKSLGDCAPPAPLNVNMSVPAWKQGASDRDGPPAPVRCALPASIASHPVHPASVNGLPPLPVMITW